MAPSSAIFFKAICSRSIVEAPGTTWGAIALWTWRRAFPEMRIFSISFGVLIMMAIVMILAVGRTEPLEGGFDRCGDLLDGLVAIDFFEASLLSVVLDDRRGLGFKGLHALDEYRLGVVGALDQDCAVLITDAGDRRGIGIGIVDAAGGRDAAAG